MPKKEIDYSNTIIYKITCLDPNITDVYVGHTTNFVQRKHGHKGSCVNEKSANYKCKLYQTIRCNGGWVNWKMEIVNFFNCLNHYEAREKEQEYFVLLKANLNSIEPLPNPRIKLPIEKKEQIPIYCQSCNVYLKNIKFLEIHNNTKKHIKLCNTPILLDNKLKSYNYECEKCKFITSNKKDYKRHLNTKKHKTKEQQYVLTANSTLLIENSEFKCVCGKIYKDKSGIWRHKKKCNVLANMPLNNIQNVPSEDKSNMDILDQQNCNIKQHICKFCKNIYISQDSLWYHNKKCQTIIDTKITQKIEENIKIIKFPKNEIIEMMKAQLVETQGLRQIMMEQSKQMMELLNNNLGQ